MSRIALLDVNVLVALADPNHVHHEAAHDWFAEQRPHGWATCPITENGFVRVLSHPGYGASAVHVDALVTLLRTFCASGHHHFWPADISLHDEHQFRLNSLGPSRHLTDVYLLGLAAHHGGRLATFDRSIPAAGATHARPATLQVISAVDG